MDDNAPSTVAMAKALTPLVAGCPEVAAAWLFGSVARGDARPDSDLDVAVLFKRGVTVTHRAVGSLASRLEAAGGGRTIDLVDLAAQGPIFRHRVLEEGRLLLDADAERRIDFESTSHVLYLDFRPTWEIAAGSSIAGFRDFLERRR